MVPDARNFLRILTSTEPGPPVLFAPFVSRYLTEQLIWRRGVHLWQTPESYIDTLTSLRERTYADVVIADARLFTDQMQVLADCMERFSADGIRYVALCGTPEQAAYFDTVGAVCALGMYGALRVGKLPVIAMEHTVSQAIEAGCAGWYCRDGMIEEHWDTCHDKIAIMGGLGEDWVRSASPAAIHKRAEECFRHTANARMAIGSGGMLPDDAYLSLISLLGIYRRYR